MHRPERAEFDRLAESFAVVPVWREVMADELTPVSAFKRLDPATDGFLLESVEGGERWARFSFLGGDAFATVKAFGPKLVVEGSPPVAPVPDEPPLAYVKRLLGAWNAPRVPGLPRFHGGAVGFIGYDCVRELEKLPEVPPDELGLPDLALILTSTFVVFDNLDQKIFVISNVPRSDSGGFDAAVERCDRVVESLGRSTTSPPAPISDPGSVEASTDVTDQEFESWVQTARDHIYAGDIFQVVPSRRFSTPLTADSFDVYRALRTINPSPYMYFLRFGAGEGHPAFDIVGSSPEPLVRVTGRTIVTRPIAGTRPRGQDEASDAQLEQELLADPKERAEHVMLVDLARNDVGRVSEYGTVKVDELMEIERYSHVMHIVSNVSGM